jgi:glucosamine kinase
MTAEEIAVAADRAGVTEATTALRLLAVDGGQSAIRIRSSALEQEVDVEGVSRDTASDDRVAAAIESGWALLGRPTVDRAVLGMTTAPVDPAQARSLARRVGEAIRAAEVWVCDDAVTSHAGALSMGWGVSVAAGTGVATLVVPDQGGPRVVGGHGYLLGDEGGAFWIGREGLRAALRASEGRAEPTALGELATRRYGALDALPVRLHDDARSIDAIARFATDVLAAATRDVVAARIVRDAASELHGVIGSAVRIARSGGTAGPIPVGLGGRLLIERTPLRDELDARLAADRTVEARTADGTPLDGAMLLAAQPTPGRYARLVHTWRPGDSA